MGTPSSSLARNLIANRSARVVSNANHGDLHWQERGVSCCTSSLTFSPPPLAPLDEAFEVAPAVPRAQEPFGAKQPNGQKPGGCYSLVYPQNIIPERKRPQRAQHWARQNHAMADHEKTVENYFFWRRVVYAQRLRSSDQKLIQHLARPQLNRQPAWLLAAARPSLLGIIRIAIFGKNLWMWTAVSSFLAEF